MPKDRKKGKEIMIEKPDLKKQKYFNSQHTTPNDSTVINNNNNNNNNNIGG
jgi:hypothetical protein